MLADKVLQIADRMAKDAGDIMVADVLAAALIRSYVCELRAVVEAENQRKRKEAKGADQAGV